MLSSTWSQPLSCTSGRVMGCYPSWHGLAHRTTRIPARRNIRTTFAAFTLKPDKDASKELTSSGKLVIGRAEPADVVIGHARVAVQHAEIEEKNGRVYCTALAGEEGNFLADTWTWLDGQQIRRGVPYICSPGTKLAFGEESNAYTLQFEEKTGSGDTSLFTMMAQQMTANAGGDVKDALNNLKQDK